MQQFQLVLRRLWRRLHLEHGGNQSWPPDINRISAAYINITQPKSICCKGVESGSNLSYFVCHGGGLCRGCGLISFQSAQTKNNECGVCSTWNFLASGFWSFNPFDGNTCNSQTYFVEMFFENIVFIIYLLVDKKTRRVLWPPAAEGCASLCCSDYTPCCVTMCAQEWKRQQMGALPLMAHLLLEKIELKPSVKAFKGATNCFHDTKIKKPHF